MNEVGIILIILIILLFIKDIIKIAFFIGSILGIAILFTNKATLDVLKDIVRRRV